MEANIQENNGLGTESRRERTLQGCTAMILASALGFLLAAIPLEGVVGDDVSARSYFDANNVHVGDPMVLTIDFIGSAEFSDLHPPALSRSVDRRTWKIDDESAKTETYMDARRLVYRVRPLKAGLLEFPSLEFTYEGSNGRGEMKKHHHFFRPKGSPSMQGRACRPFSPGLTTGLPNPCRCRTG